MTYMNGDNADCQADRNEGPKTPALLTRTPSGQTDVNTLDAAAFETLRQIMLGRQYGLRLDEDALQESLLILVRRPPLYYSEAAMYGWIRRVAICRMFNACRRKRPVADSAATEAHATSRAPVGDRHLVDRIDHLRDCLERLSNDDRIAVRMFYYEGMNCAQIATYLGTTPGAIWTRLRRARILLRRLIEEVEA